MRLVDADTLKTNLVKVFVDKFEGNAFDAIDLLENTIGNAPIIDIDAITESHEEIGYDKGFRDGYAQATSEVRHGHWINISISANGNESSVECDLCGAIVHNNFSSIINYCPNCGAKMDEDRDYEHEVEQLEHNMMFEPIYNPEDGSM